MAESDRFFRGDSGLHETLRNLTAKLDELGIAYVVIRGMALTAHGFARMTEDVDVLVTKADLKKIHAKLVGLGYKRAFDGSKNIRDTNTNAKIEFVLTGDYPGSGEPQPVSFPHPADAEPVVLGGVKFVGLRRLIELKLASGMTGGPEGGKGDDYVYLTTTDADVAKKYDMHEASEFFGEDREEEVEDAEK